MSVEDTPTIDDPKAVLAALERYKKEAKENREAKEALEAKVAEYENDDTLVKYQRRIVATEAKSRLLADGVKDPDRVLKYLKAENVKVTDDGLDGLDDVLGEVKKDFPELFDVKRRVGGGADGAATGAAPKKTATEQQVERIFARH